MTPRSLGRRGRSGPLWFLLTCVATVPLAASALPAQPRTARGASTSALIGTWRVSRGVTAPWVTATEARPDVRAWLGATVRVTARQVAGPGVLRCGAPRLEATRMPPEGLFQGGLPSPAAPAARALGFPAPPVTGVSLTCDAGIFEFHQPDAQSMLVAVDNVIWTLDRSPGASAADTAASGVVQRFLEQHFASEMAYDTSALAAKRPWLGDAFYAQLRRYMAKPANPDEAPELDGDPFTDSQEYPTRFSVGAARIAGTGAMVSVRFSDGYRSYRVAYRLVRSSGRWRIDDVVSQSGRSLQAFLRSAA
jgi:Protein of unknown function (DUF3828)